MSVEVTNAASRLKTPTSSTGRQTARAAAEKNAEAGQTRFENGVATNFEVVQLQNQLTRARLTESAVSLPTSTPSPSSSAFSASVGRKRHKAEGQG